MTEKRFEIIDKEFISYYGGNGHLISNGNCKFWLWHDESGSQKVCDKLNIIMEENEQLKKYYDISEDCNDSLSKENEELHQIQMELVTERDSLRKENTNLFNENEQLKEKIKALEDANAGLVETIAHFDIEEVL